MCAADNAPCNAGFTSPSLGSRLVLVGNSDDHRLKNLYQLDLRAEKVIPLFQKADLTLSIDMFNSLNSDTIVRQAAQLSTTACGAASTAKSCTGKGNRVEERESPRVLRFGAHLSF